MLRIGKHMSGVHKLRGDPGGSDIVANGLAIRAVQEKPNALEISAIGLLPYALTRWPTFELVMLLVNIILS